MVFVLIFLLNVLMIMEPLVVHQDFIVEPLICTVNVKIADFVGKEDAIIVSQGYGTNANLFASIADSKTLVISDELNHASIRFGIRLSGASVKVFKHNDMNDLENLIRNQIAQGQPKTHRPWNKIIVAVEGLYSMEGNMCNLPEIVRIKDKYKCYLFVDEAHSIGALDLKEEGFVIISQLTQLESMY